MINASRVGRYFIFLKQEQGEEEEEKKPIVYMNDVGMNEDDDLFIE
jgi:hypothetical protein